MTVADWLVIAVYFAITLGLSAMLARGQQSTADYYVGGRALPWWALAVSTLATQSSANSFIGIPAFVALVPGGGLSWLQYELMVPLAMAIVCVLLVPVLRGMGLISVYEYLERRFDRRTRLVLSAVFLLSRGLATGVALYAAAVLVEVCTGLPLAWCIALMGIVTVIYDCMGGMRAVVWTDVMQMVVLLGGVIACIAIATGHAGGIDAALAVVPADRLEALEWSHGLGDEARAPLWGVLVGGLVLYVSYYGVDQSQVQRQLSADSVGSAQKALALNGMVRFPLTLLYAALGVAVCAVYMLHEPLRAAVPAGRPDYLIPRYIQLYLPAGVRGLLVAAILAAAMSSLDSALNSLSASTMRDFVEPHVREDRLVWASRFVTGAWGAAIIGFGLSVGDLADNVVEGINRIGALFYGPLLAAFGCGILDRRARGPGVLAGVACGLIVNLVLAWAVGPRVFWMWWNVSGLVVATAVTLVVSRLGPAPSPAPKASLSDIAAHERHAIVGGHARRLVPMLIAYTVLVSLVVAGLDMYA